MTDNRMSWFNLARHDDPPADPPTDPPTDPPVDSPKPEDQLGDPGKKALAEERAARKAAEKALAERDAKLREYEDRDKTEAQRLAERAEAAEQRVQAATARAVKAEVKALAADQFADPADAAAFLDLSKYADESGEVDSDAIAADLADLLERKPHLKKAQARTGPRPDPSQGGGRGGGEPTDYRNAPPDEVDKALSALGIRRWR